MENKSKSVIWMTVLVAALGYFVDIYDLLLFGIVRRPSLEYLGVPQDQMLTIGVHLLNMQMTGMLIGGVFWGVLGDRRGRKSVLFGSILLYSLANIANAFVPNVEMYAILRFVAGIGLAGELGAAVTLVSEVMPKETRGYGTSIVAGVGILGAVAASLVGDFFNWKVAYIVGGVMGLALLGLRAGLLESGMFHEMKGQQIPRGDFLKLFKSKDRVLRYLSCIGIAIPIWFVIGILITFAPELSEALGVSGVTGSKSIMWAYVGLSMGDISAGLLSQYLRSRKKTVFVFLTITPCLLFAYMNSANISLSGFYTLCVLLGFGSGYWAVFVTVAAEQFGTNIRATVATSAPNFVRGAVVPITLSFEFLKPTLGLLPAAFFVGTCTIAISLISLWKLNETFEKDLKYLEPL